MTATKARAPRVKDFAPHLAGRMLPGMFAYLGIGLVERFPGDPYAHQEPWAAWFWMHTTSCMKHEHVYGTGWGLCRDKPISMGLREPHDDAPAAPAPAAPAPTCPQATLYRGPGQRARRAPAQPDLFTGTHQ